MFKKIRSTKNIEMDSCGHAIFLDEKFFTRENTRIYYGYNSSLDVVHDIFSVCRWFYNIVTVKNLGWAFCQLVANFKDGSKTMNLPINCLYFDVL